MTILTADHLLSLNLRLAREKGGIWTENKGHLNLPTVVDICNDGRHHWSLRGAMAALALVALQPFRDGNHRTGMMILYHLMICGRMMPRQSALHIYGKICELEDSARQAIGNEPKMIKLGNNLALFMGSKSKKWGPNDMLLGHIDHIVPSIAREIDRIPAQMASISAIEKQYRLVGSRRVPKDGADLSDAGQVRMYVAYARALSHCNF